MKQMKFSLGMFMLAVMTVFTLNSCQKEDLSKQAGELNNSEVKAGNSGPSSNGHGTINREDYKRHFTFHANTMPDGSFSGSGILKYSGGELDIKFDIDCLNISDNVAIMSGPITESSVPAYVGQICWFKVLDDGEGSKSEDLITLFYIFSPEDNIDCSINITNAYNPIDGGNVQVKP